MSYSSTFTDTISFTITHAKHIAAKVATDLKRLQRFYGEPSNNHIIEYEIEIIELLKKGYLKKVTFGFKLNGNFIEPTLVYTDKDLIDIDTDNDPGSIRPGANISGASFYSFLEYSSTWHNLSEVERDMFKKSLPFQRGDATIPGLSGYFNDDRIYSSGGRALYRASLRSYQ